MCNSEEGHDQAQLHEQAQRRRQRWCQSNEEEQLQDAMQDSMGDINRPTEESTYQELSSLSSCALFRQARQAGLTISMEDEHHAIINQLLEVPCANTLISYPNPNPKPNPNPNPNPNQKINTKVSERQCYMCLGR